MKKNIILFFAFLLVFLPFVPNGYAQDAAVPSLSSSPDDIKHLIETLESDTARKDLISNLNLLLEQQKKEGERAAVPSVAPALTEKLGIRGSLARMVNDYEVFLDAHAISASAFHRGAGTILASLLFGGFFMAVRKISVRLILMIDGFSTRLGIRLSRVAFYTRVLQAIFKAAIVGLFVYTIAKVWSFAPIESFFESVAMRAFLSTSATILFVAVVAAFIWESVGIYLAYVLQQADKNNQTRVKTLLPILRNIVLSVFGLLFGLVLMSELGINVAPFIAGAGVIGVAVGFGAQSMVKDFLTGFTIVLEDILRVGDVVSLGGCTGVVEKITLRKIQLRDFGGNVYTIPFSQITTIQNQTKDFSFYPLEVGVSYAQNTDRVVEVMKEVDASLRGDPAFASFILAPIEIVGVDRFADNAVVIKARIKTQPVKQWDVGREYNRRMKMAFDANGIEIPFPQRVVTIRNP